MASQSLKNLPPHVARELRRHINPAKRATSPKATAESNPHQSNRVLYGCIAFTTVSALIPLAAHYWIGGLNEREEGLTGPQVRRGAFLNSGTKDIGRDPNWDFEKGEYKEETGYAKIRGQFLAMSDSDLQKHENNLVRRH